MRGPTERELLDIWERGSLLHPVDRGLLALHAAYPATSYDTLAGWPLGARNRALAEVFASWFGAGLEAWAACDACGEQLEFEMNTRELITQHAGPTGAEPAAAVTVGSHRFRLPSSRDLALADPLAEARVQLTCPGCGHEWDDTLDLALFVWAEVEARAKRLLLDVHQLARAYGWTEGEILALSERRRRFYLDTAYP
jgi:hypothetical protein